MVDRLLRRGQAARIDQRDHGDEGKVGARAILIDYYFLHLLSLLSVRLWDDGDPDANLDRLNRLLDQLQGPDGGGQQFTADAETLMLIATSHYERNEEAFVTLLGRVRSLNREHQAKIALGHAASLGCHLRFGFEATCGRDTVATRDDNVADYPWLCYALATLMSVQPSDRPAFNEFTRVHFPEIFAASTGPVRYYVVEHDPRFGDDTFDPFEAAEKGFDYLDCVSY